MRLETYLDAMCVAHYEWQHSEQSAEASEEDWNYTRAKERQYHKFRQRIIDRYVPISYELGELKGVTWRGADAPPY